MNVAHSQRNRLRLFEALECGERTLRDVALDLDWKLAAVRNLASRMKALKLIEETDRRVPGERTRHYRLTKAGLADLARLRLEQAW